MYTTALRREREENREETQMLENRKSRAHQLTPQKYTWQQRSNTDPILNISTIDVSTLAKIIWLPTS